MKVIHSPYRDNDFNEYLLNYCKARLKQRALIFECQYKVESSHDNEIENTYSIEDVIKLIQRKDNVIFFSNTKLINHIVYDLGQRFWYNELCNINNIVHKLYMIYRGEHDKSITDTERKSSINKFDR